MKKLAFNYVIFQISFYNFNLKILLSLYIILDLHLNISIYINILIVTYIITCYTKSIKVKNVILY